MNMFLLISILLGLIVAVSAVGWVLATMLDGMLDDR